MDKKRKFFWETMMQPILTREEVDRETQRINVQYDPQETTNDYTCKDIVGGKGD